MIKDEKIYVLGSSWISSFGYGLFGSKPQFSYDSEHFKYPELQNYIAELPPRFGRFDNYTKVCFSAAVLALKDAGLLQRKEKENIGIVVGSRTGVYDNDISFFESTQEEKGAFSSPNLFSYTLPNVALGEIAVFFNFIGPSFCVGNDPVHPGMDVFSSSLSLLESKQCTKVLIGWAEAAKSIKKNEKFPKGAEFAVLSSDKTSTTKAEILLNKNTYFSELFE
jgi:hypothetical protein